MRKADKPTDKEVDFPFTIFLTEGILRMYVKAIFRLNR